MDIKKLQKLAVSALEDIKAKDIEVINTSKLTAMFDKIIVATGDSNRQVNALARSVHDKVKEAGGAIVGMEGEDSGEWVLVDLGDIVVHIMQPVVRAHYNLEELWQTVPKRVSAPVAKKATTTTTKLATTRTSTRTTASAAKTATTAAKKPVPVRTRKKKTAAE